MSSHRQGVHVPTSPHAGRGSLGSVFRLSLFDTSHSRGSETPSHRGWGLRLTDGERRRASFRASTAVPCVFLSITSKWETAPKSCSSPRVSPPLSRLRPEVTAWTPPCMGAGGEARVSLKKVALAARGPARGREGRACPLQQGVVASCPPVSGLASGTRSLGRMAARLQCQAWRGLGWHEPRLLRAAPTGCHRRGRPRLRAWDTERRQRRGRGRLISFSQTACLVPPCLFGPGWGWGDFRIHRAVRTGSGDIPQLTATCRHLTGKRRCFM